VHNTNLKDTKINERRLFVSVKNKTLWEKMSNNCVNKIKVSNDQRFTDKKMLDH
jgi:hypothetical protein